MLSLFIILILVLGVVAVSYNTQLNMMNSSNQLYKSISERTTVTSWVSSIQSAMRPYGVNRTLVVPNGVTNSEIDYMKPPSQINLPEVNSWGNDYIYCPYARTEASGTASFKSGAGNTYSGTLITGADGIEYVASVAADADPTSTGLVAAIISPLPSADELSCDDIRYDSINKSYYTVNYNGVVYGLNYNAMVVSNVADSVVLESGGTSLDAEAELWPSVLPDVFTVNAPSADGYYLTETINFVNPVGSKEKVINIFGEGMDVSRFDRMATGTVLRFENVTVNLSNVTFRLGMTLEFINSKVTLNNANLPLAKFENSTVSVVDIAHISAYGDVVTIKNSSFNAPNSELYLRSYMGGLAFDVQNSDLAINDLSMRNFNNGGVMMVFGHGSKLTVTGSLMSQGSSLDAVISGDKGSEIYVGGPIAIQNVVDAAFYMLSDFTLYNSAMTFTSSPNVAVMLGGSGTLDFEGSSIAATGSAPVIGVQDIGGAKFVVGTGSGIVASSACWDGVIFTDANGQVSGNTSEPTSDTFKGVNRSNWNCVIN